MTTENSTLYFSDLPQRPNLIGYLNNFEQSFLVLTMPQDRLAFWNLKKGGPGAAKCPDERWLLAVRHFETVEGSPGELHFKLKI